MYQTEAFISDDLIRKSVQGAVDTFDRHNLPLLEHTQIVIIKEDSFCQQLFDMFTDYTNIPRNYNFWEYLVIQNYTKYRKSQTVSKQCYTFIHSWNKHHILQRELKVALSLVNHPHSFQMIKFFIKCRKIYETFCNKKIRQDVFKLDSYYLPMEACILSLKRLFREDQQEIVNSKYIEFLSNLRQQFLVFKDEVPSVEFLCFCLTFYEFEFTLNDPYSRIVKMNEDVTQQTLRDASNKKSSNQQYSHARSTSTKTKYQDTSENYKTLKRKLDELESYNNHITLEFSNIQNKYRYLLELTSRIVSEVKNNNQLIMTRNQDFSQLINEFDLMKEKENFDFSGVQENVSNNQSLQNSNIIQPQNQQQQFISHIENEEPPNLLFSNPIQVESKNKPSIKENSKYSDKIKLTDTLYQKAGTRSFYFIPQDQKNDIQSKSPKKKIFENVSSPGISGQHQQIVQNIEDLKNNFRQKLVQQMSDIQNDQNGSKSNKPRQN